MDCTLTGLEYSSTGYFSPIVLDYLQQSTSLQPFIEHAPTEKGLIEAIEKRKNFATKRSALVEGLQLQYTSVKEHPNVTGNISRLGLTNSFTVVTAHQPAIFTGTLYFIYKILHAIKLCESLSIQYPSYNFIPVYFMGSEDADLDELGKIFLSGDELRWNTQQQGAVGRMQVKDMDPIMNRISGELGVLPHGKELVELLQNCYRKGSTIQQATFELLHTLFAEYGLVVFIPDNKVFKEAMLDIFRKDLFEHLPFQLVNESITALQKDYKIQVNPREINLFYLEEGARERIEQVDDNMFRLVGAERSFTRKEMEDELMQHPEKFSPNVILRGVMQEIMLPNIAFIGGGGELAYWMEYLGMFQAFGVPYPVLILRNSFLLIEEKWKLKIDKLGLSYKDIFASTDDILKQIATNRTTHQVTLQKEISELHGFYENLGKVAGEVDASLVDHIKALESRTIKPLVELEKKMVRAEKRKYEAELRQVEAIKKALFPKNSLQERVENFMPYYAKYGKRLFECLYQNSASLEQEFRIVFLPSY